MKDQWHAISVSCALRYVGAPDATDNEDIDFILESHAKGAPFLSTRTLPQSSPTPED